MMICNSLPKKQKREKPSGERNYFQTDLFNHLFWKMPTELFYLKTQLL